MNELVLSGLDGANPLGFLAALGVLNVLADDGQPARLRWRDEGGWRPVVSGHPYHLDELVELIDADRRDCIGDPALALEYEGKQDLKPPPDGFRRYLEQLVEQCAPEQRRSIDWASAFATDVARDNNGNTKPTALHFTAGKQLFLAMVNELVRETTRDDIHEALTGPWTYSRPLPVMGWDSTASRAYALRAANPATEKKLGVPGADWLAVRGISFFPLAPIGERVMTTGCSGGWKNGHYRWGLWNVDISRNVIRSMLRLALPSMTTSERAAKGIAAVFSCGIKRSDQGGYGTFEPAAVS